LLQLFLSSLFVPHLAGKVDLMTPDGGLHLTNRNTQKVDLNIPAKTWMEFALSLIFYKGEKK